VPDVNGGAAEYVLRLYVLGATPTSRRARANLEALCANELAGRCDLEIIDVYQHPERAAEDQVLAVPTLVKSRPLPVRRLTGDMSDAAEVRAGLDLDG
jgi:circadian clock protein KaiB